VNPAHLFIGTQHDNVQDMMSKGRYHRHVGSKHPRAKLTKAQVAEMRLRRAEEGAKYRDLAAEYGVCLRTTAMILKGLIWKQTSTPGRSCRAGLERV
jgi:hypothetical protein